MTRLATGSGDLAIALGNRLSGRGADSFTLDQRGRLDDILECASNHRYATISLLSAPRLFEEVYRLLIKVESKSFLRLLPKSSKIAGDVKSLAARVDASLSNIHVGTLFYYCDFKLNED